MALEVYYPQDIRNALRAAEQAVSVTADATGTQGEPFVAGFLSGYRAALVTIALAFGLVRANTSGTQSNGREWQSVFLSSVERR